VPSVSRRHRFSRFREAHDASVAAGPVFRTVSPPLPCLLRNNARAFAASLDVHGLAGSQVRVYRLCYGDQYTALYAHDDLLPRHRLIVSLLDIIAEQCTTKGSGDHRHVAPRAPPDQAADAQATEAADDRPYTPMLVALQLDWSDLLDHTLADFLRSRVLSERIPGREQEG